MSGIDFVLLRRQISLTQVLDLVGFTPTTRCGPQWRGPCPVHGSKSRRSRSFAAQVEKNCWHCFRCGAHGNALDLWAAATGLPLYEASRDLCQRLHLEIPWLSARHSPARSPPKT